MTTDLLTRLRELEAKATPGPWETECYICRADRGDVKFAKSEGRELEVGDELWRQITAYGPFWPDHSHWAGMHISASEEDVMFVEALRNHAIPEIERLTTELAVSREREAKMREALDVAEDAIREMFRYYDGGETRGSYDGRPERAQLRHAGDHLRRTRAALETGDAG